MKFSLLIAFYNNFEYFKECYQSIVEQTHPVWEIIIVDDNSNEDNFLQLKELVQSDARFKIYRNQENKGVGFTKSLCADLATGDICGFIDPDDVLELNAVELSLKAYTNQDIVATHSHFGMYNHNMEFLKPFPTTQKVKSFRPKFLNIRFEINHFFTFRRDIYLQTEKINPTLSSAVDQDLYLKMYEMGKIQFIDSSLYKYRLHDKGVSQDKSRKQKLYNNWNLVIRNTLQRRNIEIIYGKNISEIDNLVEFILKNENTLISKIQRKISCLFK